MNLSAKFVLRNNFLCFLYKSALLLAHYGSLLIVSATSHWKRHSRKQLINYYWCTNLPFLVSTFKRTLRTSASVSVLRPTFSRKYFHLKWKSSTKVWRGGGVVRTGRHVALSSEVQSIFIKKYFTKQRSESKRERELREIIGGVGRSIFMRARHIAFTSINALAITFITCDRNMSLTLVAFSRKNRSLRKKGINLWLIYLFIIIRRITCLLYVYNLWYHISYLFITVYYFSKIRSVQWTVERLIITLHRAT